MVRVKKFIQPVSFTVRAPFNSAILAERYPHLEETLGQWRQLGDKLLQLSYDTPSSEAMASHLEELARVQKQCNDLETQLAREVPEIQLQKQTCDRKTVAITLPAGVSLVEFVRFRVWNFQEDRWQDPRYLAFILPAGQPSQVEMVDLGDAGELDNFIAGYRETLVTRDKSSNAPAESESGPKLHLYNKNAGSQLREAVFDKLRSFLGSCRNLIYQKPANSPTRNRVFSKNPVSLKDQKHLLGTTDFIIVLVAALAARIIKSWLVIVQTD